MNRLASSTSPYLRQHAGNPVEWYPWGEEAFARARQEDKPLFVSIGYSACHWCHVMAHESFEDPAVAQDLAASFVSVKVDREERPDVDALYMAAAQAMTGSGGWPLSVFVTPDGRPFFAGTYFPPADRHGLPGFRSVLAALAEAWKDRREEVEEQAEALAQAVAAETAVADRLRPAHRGPLGSFDELAAGVVSELSRSFDATWGGFSGAPKFPHPALVETCLRHHLRTGDPASLTMARTTLKAMAAGGIYDHLAGGFCRYATDRTWLVPHFEKMLTDQALLARCYLHAWQVSGDLEDRQVAIETLEYLLGDLALPGGGLCASEDADAAGVEGGHATFTEAQLRQALVDAGRAHLVEEVAAWYGVTARGNWEGTCILHRPPGAPLARPPAIEEARRILLAARRARPAPARDDKVVTEWNAMAAAVLAEAAGVLDRPDWARAARTTVEFLLAALRDPDGRRVLRSWRDGQRGPLGFAADYAWLVEACTRLVELTGEPRWLAQATTLADDMLALFWDSAPGSGGLFTTGQDAEQLFVRAKDLVDGATPSANAAAASALGRLGLLSGHERFTRAAREIVELAAPLLAAQPRAMADMLAAWSLVSEGAEIVVAGDRPDLLAVVRARWLPTAVLAWGQPTPSPLWEGRSPGRAYVCRSYVCQTPAADPATLAQQLHALTGPGPARTAPDGPHP